MSNRKKRFLRNLSIPLRETREIDTSPCSRDARKVMKYYWDTDVFPDDESAPPAVFKAYKRIQKFCKEHNVTMDYTISDMLFYDGDDIVGLLSFFGDF